MANVTDSKSFSSRLVSSRLVVLACIIAVSIAATTNSISIAQEVNYPPNYHKAVADRVPNRYIVTLKEEAVEGLREKILEEKITAFADEVASKYQGQVLHTYAYALKGFAIDLPNPKSAIELCQADIVESVNEVRYISLPEPNPILNEASAVTQPQELYSILGSQDAPHWGLDRIDQRSQPLNNKYNYLLDGSGVNVYIVDSGIRRTHQEFEGRVVNAADFSGDTGTIGSPAVFGRDCFGHGTRVASLVGGKTYGVAKKAKMFNVRAYACSSTTDDTKVTAGVNWVIQYHAKPAILSFSIVPLGQTLPAYTVLLQNAINAGITVIIASGNSNVLVSSSGFPGTLSQSIIVGASSRFDERSIYSNGGPFVNLFAPGDDLPSAAIFDDTSPAPSTGSGSSFAAPMVAGLAAMYLQQCPEATPRTIKDAITRNATQNKIRDYLNPGTGFGHLLYTGFRMNRVVSSASYNRKIARDSIATAFGVDLTAFNRVSVENPTVFGSSWNSIISAVTPGQINFIVPSEIQPGVAIVRTTSSLCALFQCDEGHSSVLVSRIAPALFTANASGSGLVNGHLLRVNKATGQQKYETLTTAGNILYTTTENYYLVLYGTGFRYRNALSDVAVKLNNVSLPILYAGLTPGVNGLDQINVELPATFLQRGTMSLTWSVENEQGNPLQVTLLNP